MQKIIEFIKSLEFSLTVAWVILLKACIVSPTFVDATFFLCAILNIVHERFERANAEARHDEMIDHNITAVQNRLQALETEQQKTLVVAEAAKKALSEISLSQTFTRPKRQ